MGLAEVSLGVDFDNTLICYDGLFHQAARERGLIPSSVPANKKSIRQYLRSAGREDAWTELQGTVYGSRIGEAPPFLGALDALRNVLGKGVAVAIVSHRTRTPIRGAAVDLHGAAFDWIEARGIFDLGLPRDRVFLEETREAKLVRIGALGLTHFLDDLKEVLLAPGFPSGAVPLLFSPCETEGEELPCGIRRVRAWRELMNHLSKEWGQS